MTSDLDDDIARLRSQRRRYMVARLLMVPVLILTLWLSVDQSALWLIGGTVLLLVMQYFGLRAYLQYCPRCLSSLAAGQWWARSLPPRCPMCDLPIDVDRVIAGPPH